MITSEKVVTINRPVFEVFDYVSEPENFPHWQSELTDVHRISTGPLGVGSRFKSVRKFLGRKSQGDVEFTDFELNRKIAFKSISGPMPFDETFLFEPADGGTKVTARLELQPSGLLSLAQPVLASEFKHEVKEDIDCLKETIENRVVENFELLE